MMQNNYDNNDLRVKRTQKLILGALIEVTAQKGFSSVTVSDITKYAGINRATFYRHYKDKFDLLNKYIQHVYELMETPLETTLQNANEADMHQIPARLVKIFEHIRDNAKFYRVMLGKNGDPVFAERIRMFIQKRIRRSLPIDLPKEEQSIDLFVSYSSNASFGAVLWWLEHNMPYSPEEMILIIQQLESGNFKNFVL